MIFFFDRCMPRRLARMVDILETEHQIVHHDDDSRFNHKTTDIEWITALRGDQDPWIIVSGDGRILRNKAESAVLRESGLTFFCLSKQWPQMPLREEYVWKFFRIWPEIVKKADITRQRVFEVCGGSSLKVEEMRF
jgi:hypothetical protein